MGERPFGIYIHWPFCLSKCPYCDFNSHVRQRIDESAWREALCAELDHIGAQTHGRRLTSVFFGGGTPSLMAPQTVGAILDRLNRYWPLAPDIEITLEANPTSVEIQKFRDFKKAGLNRVSLGIQALQDANLRFLGREHSREEALAALKIASTVFERFSFDLIYARPHHTLDQWRAELTEALSYARDHLSLYQLTIEPGTAFHTAFHRGEWTLPEEHRGADLYEVTQEILATHNLQPYEISNYARPGEECRHNLLYWRYQEYAPLGPGAQGRLVVGGQWQSLKRLRAPETWLKAVQTQGHGTQSSETLSSQERLTELLMMGLRLSEGVNLTYFHQVTGQTFRDTFSASFLNPLLKENLITLSSDRVTATPQGRQRLNSLLSYLLQAIDEKRSS